MIQMKMQPFCTEFERLALLEFNFMDLRHPGGGGVLPNMGYIGMCGPKG